MRAHRESSLRARPPRHVWQRLALVLILVMAALFRFYRLDAIPPGVTHDEAATGYFAASVYRGTPARIDVPYGYAYQPFTQYSGALFMALFGPSDLALRLHSAFFGMLLVVFTYLWAREAFGVTVGLGSAGMVGVSFWTVCDSRFALNSAPAPALFTAAVYFLWRALNCEEGSRPWSWGLFALLLGGSLYVYEAALAATASCVLLFFLLVFVDRALFRRHATWFAGALFAAGLIAAPHLLSSAFWGRTSTLAGPLLAARQGDWRPLLQNAIAALGTFSFRGDSLVTYNLPGRPIFDPVASLFFYGGVALCLWRWRKPAHAFVVLWLVTGILPSLIIGEWTSTLHSKAAEGAIMTLPVLCAWEVGRLLEKRAGLRWARVFGVACIVWLCVIAASTGYDYFIRWGQAPETRAAYFQNLAAITDYLAHTEYNGAVVLSSPFPDLPLDPFIARLRLQREDLSLRWCDARRALVFPDATRALLVLPSNTPLAVHLDRELQLQLAERVHLRPDDIDPTFDVYEWYPSVALSGFETTQPGATAAGDRALDLPVSVGGAVELVAYELLEETVRPGGTVTLATIWRVLSPGALGPVPADAYGHTATVFVHALDGTNRIIGQEDRLDAPAWNWRAGDAFVQLHRFQIDAHAPPGRYPLEVGLYTNHDMARLPIIVDGEVIDDRVLLQPLEIREQ
ncbi:MAG: glycosyltransferase family 39 protein [Anaerolineae bacterium]